MRVLWLYLLVNTVTTQAGFGRSYLGNSRLCHTWNCLNQHLNLTDALPPRDQYAATIRALLPGSWSDTLDVALDVCYGNRTRKYTNTCPGQALLHCTVDQLIQNCPSESWVKPDGCTPLSSVAAFPYMFSQSRYINLAENLPIERRPTWFLTNYFNTKCCELPQLFPDSVLQRCNFSQFMFYHVHQPQRASVGFEINRQPPVFPTSTPSEVQHATKDENENLDPLSCCDMSEFIRPEWRARCGFDLRWGPNRLDIASPPVVTTPAPTMSTVKTYDVKIVPLKCHTQDCIYRRLGIISDNGVDIEGFAKLLDNMTDHNPEWSKAKARVVTKCLSKPIQGYDAECPLSPILGCTADILSENCPNAPKNDPCKYGGQVPDGITCQISASLYRPKNRRQFCSLPNLVSLADLDRCNVVWTWRQQNVPAQLKPTTKKWAATSNCKELTESTTCLLSQMGVLNKYGFLDYFKMKDRIREFSHENWSQFGVYNAAFQSMPLYREYCSSPKKLLNVLDAMLMTCPASKRSNSRQCAAMFNEMSNLHNVTQQKLDNIMSHLQNIFIPPPPPQKLKRVTIKTNAIYDFGIFNNDDVPPVKLIDVKPKNKPLVLIPVYQRIKYPLHQVNNDGVFRGAGNIKV
ncbi:uncharacterized protein LOC121733508 isoform X2 [Aricia agestis]|uniref:uncharacterized protein LOC121733508 isoform X2 n=1 Tax=Aricia agestis TaxID=91739 RepID=UPI001C20640F|nr:uncharacterized protein LOC121733508 isoform X2 [Aricia agestis]